MSLATSAAELAGPPPVIMLKDSFTDIGEFGRAAGWNLDFRQLEPGPLEAKVLVVGHPKIFFSRFTFNRGYHQLGKPPEGYWTFGIPDPDVGPFLWNGAETPDDVLINFSHEKGLDVVNPPGGSGGVVVSFDPEVLKRVRRDMGLPEDLLDRSRERRFSNPSPERSGQLRSLLLDMAAVARTEGDAGLAHWSSVFNHDLAALVLRSLAGPELKPRMVLPLFRARALDRAVALLASHEQMPSNVESLCHIAGASWATLLRAFKESFGLSPKAYMKVRRLTAVREALLASDGKVRITDIANRWGFWHMGSFAADYRRQFGELPSATRARLTSSD
ncbi:MAG: helix-turn-helix domain-containing protein [Pseudomonadota bacterium]